jgi:tyrosine-specific transport protein
VVRRGTRRPLRQRCLCSQYADERQPPDSPAQPDRLFSNLNQATMKHEPGNARPPRLFFSELFRVLRLI